MTPPMADVMERLQAYADDPMWADHAEVPKKLLVAAVAEITRARLSQAGAGGRVVDLVEAVKHLSEVSDGVWVQGVSNGEMELLSKAWARVDQALAALSRSPSARAYKSTSDADWEENVRLLSGAPATPVQPTASVEAVRAALLEAREYAPRRDGIVGRLDAALASLTPAPTQGDGGAKLCQHAPTYDAGLCCGHPDDCTFIRPQAEREEPR